MGCCSAVSLHLLPGGSEALLWGFSSFIRICWGRPWPCRGQYGWRDDLLGLWSFLTRWQRLASLPQGKQVERWEVQFSCWPGCLSSAMLFVSQRVDAFALAALLRVHGGGKFLRYWIVAQTAL